MLDYDSDSSTGEPSDAFQISRLAGKKPRLDEASPSTPVKVSAAPDVLSEVRFSVIQLGFAILICFSLGPLEPKYGMASFVFCASSDQNCLFSASLVTRPTDTVMNVNIGYDDMTKPIVGPENPFAERRFQNQNTISGACESSSPTTILTVGSLFRSCRRASDDRACLQNSAFDP